MFIVFSDNFSDSDNTYGENNQYCEACSSRGGQLRQPRGQEGLQPHPRPQEDEGQVSGRGQGLCLRRGDGAELGDDRDGDDGQLLGLLGQLVPQLLGAPDSHRGGGVAPGQAPGAAGRHERGDDCQELHADLQCLDQIIAKIIVI